MKKILTVSLFAIMAVGAANAEIASTKYVDDRTGSATFAAGSSIASSKDLTVAVNVLADKVDTVVGNGTGSVADQISDALKDADATKFSTSVQESLTKADNAVQSSVYAQDKNKLNEDIADAKKAGDDAATAIANLDGTDTLADGKYYKAYAQTDGKISMTPADFKTAIDALDGEGKSTEASLVAPTAKAVSDFVAANVSKISNENLDDERRLTALESAVTADGALRDQFDDLKVAGLTAETLANANSALQKSDITKGSADGTIAVEGTDVEVAGLKSAAYTESAAYATAAQGIKADNAVARTQIGAADDFAITDECKAKDAVCSLVVREGVAGWEKVSY